MAKTPINYLFFGFYLAVIALVHVFHVFLIEPVISFSTYFFATYALAQTVLETLLMILCAGLIRAYVPRFINLFALIVFSLFLARLVDFMLVRLLDMSFWYALHFVSQESYENFIELLVASNVSIFIWVIAGLCAVAILLSGIFFYRLSEKWSARKTWTPSFPLLGVLICSVSLFLVSWDFGMKKKDALALSDRFEKALPWKSTFLQPRANYLALKNPLCPSESEDELMRKLDSRFFSLTRKPDIYLFIIESLREDFITEDNAPHLKKFKDQNIAFEMALSNANATHLSWFSLFYSKFPFHWGKVDPDAWKGGSVPLRLLKKMGYQIHVSSSSHLAYYQMNRLIFGEGEHLADTIFFPDEEECNAPYLRDQSALSHLTQKMQEDSSGRVFIVFLDATHFDYSWPKENTRYTPIEERVNYIKAALSRKGLDEIINRYRNALYFVDGQFEKFMDALERAPGGKEAVVIVTGDHGEEFYEHGTLFHISGLSHPQTNPPLYYRFAEVESIKEKVQCQMTSHMDIFPTLFHYLLGEDLMEEVLQGQSIFKAERWPFTVIARFNASRTPYEYCIHNGKEKLIAQFSDERNIFSSLGLKILATKNRNDENVEKEISAIHEEFGPALQRIFPPKSL